MPSVAIEVLSADRRLASRLMGVGNLVPGARREVHSGALLVFEGDKSKRPPGSAAYAFSLEFGSEAVAAAAANWMWSQLQGHAAELRVDGEDVPVQHGAIKDALLAAADRSAD
jgi:hypothetical protein